MTERSVAESARRSFAPKSKLKIFDTMLRFALFSSAIQYSNTNQQLLAAYPGRSRNKKKHNVIYNAICEYSV